MILQLFRSRVPLADTVRRYRGSPDHRDLQAVSTLRWLDLVADPPYTSWARCTIVNEGPGDVELGVNHPNGRTVLGPGGTLPIDEKVLSLFYIARPGQAVNLSVDGVY